MAAKQQPQTLTEFQAWLEGVEELQPKGWTPDKAQWAKIRKRIANIKESEPAPAPQPRMMQPPPGPAPAPYPQPGPAPMAPAPLMQAPTDVDMSPAAKQLLSTGKLPDVDASSGNADSLFE